MKDLKNTKLNTVEIFCAAAKASSFTKASIELGTTPSSVSKAVQRLESSLGIKLFHRSTRSMRLTDDGLVYYETCRQALDSIEEIENVLTQNTFPQGVLRISVPYSYGVKRLIPIITKYIKNYDEKLKIEVSLNNSVVDFTKQGFDLAIRLGNIADSRLVARSLHSTQLKLVASPEYLQQYGTPNKIDELSHHRCLGMTLPDTGNILPWVFGSEGEGEGKAKVNPRMTFDHPLGLLSSVLSGAGIAQLLDFTVEEDLHKGHLIELLTTFRPPHQAVYVVYPSNKYVPARVRSFIDFLYENN